MVYDMIPEDASSKSSMARTDLRHTKSGYVKQERASNKRDSCIARRRTGSIEFVHLINAYLVCKVRHKKQGGNNQKRGPDFRKTRLRSRLYSYQARKSGRKRSCESRGVVPEGPWF